MAVWERYNAEALVGLTCRTYEPEGLLARQVNVALGSVRVADITGNPHVIERPPGLVESRPKEATFVSLLLEGEGFFYSSTGCLTVGAGDVVVYRTDRPYLFGFGRPMRQLLVDVPHDVAGERCAGAGADGPQAIDGRGSSAPAVTAGALRELLLGGLADPAVAGESVGEQVLDLVAAMTAGRRSPVDAARTHRAKAHVLDHLQDPGLDADAVARAVGVTARHLNRGFVAEGTTVTQFIQRQRLERARRDLVRRPAASDRIGDVASRWCFASQAHFTRLFRAAYGCTPTQYRTEHTARA
nr:AraC family transcriptional regulator [Blastococcus saxobsidens]